MDERKNIEVVTPSFKVGDVIKINDMKDIGIVYGVAIRDPSYDPTGILYKTYSRNYRGDSRFVKEDKNLEKSEMSPKELMYMFDDWFFESEDMMKFHRQFADDDSKERKIIQWRYLDSKRKQEIVDNFPELSSVDKNKQSQTTLKDLYGRERSCKDRMERSKKSHGEWSGAYFNFIDKFPNGAYRLGLEVSKSIDDLCKDLESGWWDTERETYIRMRHYQFSIQTLLDENNFKSSLLSLIDDLRTGSKANRTSEAESTCNRCRLHRCR